MYDVNMWHVLLGGVVMMIIGMLWYAPKTLGTAWMQSAGLSAETMNEAKQKGMGLSYFLNFVSGLVFTYILSHLMILAGPTSFREGAWVGFMIWLGFIATSMLGPVLWERKPWRYYAINTGYYLVALVLISGLLTVLS